MSYIDIAIIVLMALLALVGLWKGVFKSVVSFCGGLIAMLLAVLLTKVVSYALLDINSVANFVCGSSGFSLYGKILDFLPAKGSESGILKILVDPIYTKIAGYAGFESASAATSRQAVALMLAYGIFSVIVCMGLFIVFRVLMILFTMFVKSLSKGGKPGGVSRLFGFIVGAIRGFAYSMIILMILSYLIAIPQLSMISNQIDNSVIAKPVMQTVRNTTDKLFTGKDSATIEKLVAISGLDLNGEDIPDEGGEDIPDDGGEELPPENGDEELPPENGDEELSPDNGGGGGDDNNSEDNGGGGGGESDDE